MRGSCILIHDMIVKALLFLLGGTIIHLTGTSKIKAMSGLIRLHPQLGWIVFIAALSLSGLPPLSRFIGKIFITEGTFQTGYFWLGGSASLQVLMVLYSVMKIFIECFRPTDHTEETEKGTTKGLLLPLGILTALTIVLGLGAEGISEYVDFATTGLIDPNIYIKAVLGSNVQ